MQLGQKIRELRVKKSYSLDDMADLLNMSISNYSSFEQGKININFSKLEEICKVLETDVFEILNSLENTYTYDEM